MQKKTNKLEETASKTGLKININKTKTMRARDCVSTQCTPGQDMVEA